MCVRLCVERERGREREREREREKERERDVCIFLYEDKDTVYSLLVCVFLFSSIYLSRMHILLGPHSHTRLKACIFS